MRECRVAWVILLGWLLARHAQFPGFLSKPTKLWGMTAIVSVQGLSKRYGPVHALEDVTFDVPKGSVFGILGPNGAGKSTLLKTMMGLVSPSSGSVSVDGSEPGSAQALKAVGALIESSAFVPGLSGKKNLRVLAAARDVPSSRVDEVLRIVGLVSAANRKFGGYSLGMKQRLGIAAALLSSPQLIVLDEPTNGLDPQGIADVRELVMKLAKSGLTVIFSSHVLVEVERVCNHVLVLNEGTVAASLTVAQLRGATSGNAVRRFELTASPGDVVLPLLRGAGYDVPDTPPADDTWLVSLDVSQVPQLVRSLVERDVDIYRLVPTDSDLESTFFSLLHGKQNTPADADADVVSGDASHEATEEQSSTSDASHDKVGE